VTTNRDDIKTTLTDDGILQANATVIAGVLIFLTLSSFAIGLPQEISRLYVIVFTAAIIFPFAVSSWEIIRKGTATKKAKVYSRSGFVYLLVIIVVMISFGVIGTIRPSVLLPNILSSVAELCAKDPTKYNITHLSACSKFTTGSLAEECALRPEQFHLTLKKCPELIS
jgi:hypothetical protein